MVMSIKALAKPSVMQPSPFLVKLEGRSASQRSGLGLIVINGANVPIPYAYSHNLQYPLDYIYNLQAVPHALLS